VSIIYTILNYETEVTKSSSNRLVVLVDSYLGATFKYEAACVSVSMSKWVEGYWRLHVTWLPQWLIPQTLWWWQTQSAHLLYPLCGMRHMYWP